MAEREPAPSEPQGGPSLPGFPALAAPGRPQSPWLSRSPSPEGPDCLDAPVSQPPVPGAGERPPQERTRTHPHPGTRAPGRRRGSGTLRLARAGRAPPTRAGRGGASRPPWKVRSAASGLCLWLLVLFTSRARSGLCPSSTHPSSVPVPQLSVRPLSLLKPPLTTLPTGAAKWPFHSGVNARAQRRPGVVSSAH